MSTGRSYTARWKWCVLTSLAMVLLSLVPQIQLWIVRGRAWNGAYVATQGDEPLYSAYINALIDGRTRKNDPFGGKDSVLDSPLPESTFSIQFIPPYAIALVARIVGMSASTAFIVLICAAAFLASLSVFWLLDAVTADHQIAAVGTLFTLCLGWVVGRYGVFNTFFDIGIPALHFLRRYQPAAAFPSFFAFQLLVWRALSELNSVGRITSIFAGLTVVVLIFSYLYLWTSAVAWAVCIGALWFYFRAAERRNTLGVITTIGAMTAVALIPYVYLISHRGATLDQQQTLISTHKPDLFRAHELLGAVVLILLAIGIRRGKIKWEQSQVLFAASLGVLPFVVFNQQVLTGKAMQPFHFEIFVVNYSTLVGLVVTATLLMKPLSRRFLILAATLFLVWGFLVVAVPTRLVFLSAAIANDRRIPLLLRLKELSNKDGTLWELRARGEASTLVFSPSFELATLLPTWTPQPTLLDLGGLDYGNVTHEQRRQFFYMHLYYSRVDSEVLRNALTNPLDRSHEELSSVRSVLFGHERVIPALTPQFTPVRADEIEREVHNYQVYINSFSREEALKRSITYAVVPATGNFDFTNIDHWYERDAGEQVGDYVLYRLKLKP